MSEEVKANANRSTDYEIFRESIHELDRSLKRSVGITALEILALLGAITFPLWFGDISNDHLITVSVVDGFLLLISFSRGYDLLRCRQTRLILAKQLQIAAKQRVRAGKLYGLSILDPLTGLHNRRFGEERLKQFSRRLRRAIRSCDVPVRIGGDEFLVILPECPRDKVETILSRIETPKIEFSGQKISVQYSSGRAHYQYGDTMESLLGRADETLYTQKAARPRRLDSPKSAAESMDSEGAETAKIGYRHARKLDEANWERP